jgi:hypothetical protein
VSELPGNLREGDVVRLSASGVLAEEITGPYLPAEVPGFGEFLHNLLNPASRPGLPWTHTFVPPDEGRHWDRFMPDEDEDGDVRKCPVHGTEMIYSPAHDDYACQDVTCRYGHGGG